MVILLNEMKYRITIYPKISYRKKCLRLVKENLKYKEITNSMTFENTKKKGR